MFACLLLSLSVKTFKLCVITSHPYSPVLFFLSCILPLPRILPFFFLRELLQLGGRPVSDSAHWVLVRPRSGRRAHGSPGRLQGRVRGGPRCSQVAWQAAYPPGELETNSGIFHFLFFCFVLFLEYCLCKIFQFCFKFILKIHSPLKILILQEKSIWL